jgi:hypothetical protein
MVMDRVPVQEEFRYRGISKTILFETHHLLPPFFRSVWLPLSIKTHIKIKVSKLSKRIEF